MNIVQLKGIGKQLKAHWRTMRGWMMGDRAEIVAGQREAILCRAETGFAISRNQELEELQAFLKRVPRVR